MTVISGDSGPDDVSTAVFYVNHPAFERVIIGIVLVTADTTGSLVNEVQVGSSAIAWKGYLMVVGISWRYASPSVL